MGENEYCTLILHLTKSQEKDEIGARVTNGKLTSNVVIFKAGFCSLYFMELQALHLIYMKNALPYVIQPILLLGNLRTINVSFVCAYVYVCYTYICICVCLCIYLSLILKQRQQI